MSERPRKLTDGPPEPLFDRVATELNFLQPTRVGQILAL